jgi:DNA-binding transcriptional LysR family regulator
MCTSAHCHDGPAERDRTGNRWLLTDNAEHLPAHAEAIKSTMHAVAKLGVNRRVSGLGGTVRLSALDEFESTVVARALVDLQRVNPQLEINLRTATRRFDVTYRDHSHHAQDQRTTTCPIR